MMKSGWRRGRALKGDTAHERVSNSLQAAFKVQTELDAQATAADAQLRALIQKMDDFTGGKQP